MRTLTLQSVPGLALAVRSGIRNSLFTVQPPEVAEAIDVLVAYVLSL